METLFLAFAVPDAVANALVPLYRHYASVIAMPIPREKLHVTLLWLGPAEVPPEHITELTKPLPQSFVPTVRLTHVGRGRVRDQLWAWGEAAGPLVAVRDQLIERLKTIGWVLPKQEPRNPFTPHITVASLFEQMSHVGIADHPFIESYAVKEAILYKSTSQPNRPSVYSLVNTITLV